MKKVRLIALFFVFFTIVLNCGNDPPDIEDAKKMFTQFYPEARLVKVQNTYNDWDCAGFTFTYRKTGDVGDKEIYFQWIQDYKTKVWQLDSEPPKQLP